MALEVHTHFCCYIQLKLQDYNFLQFFYGMRMFDVEGIFIKKVFAELKDFFCVRVAGKMNINGVDYF